MTGIKAKLMHFETDGDIIHDFVAARVRRAAKLRTAIHACFYIQCVIAAACIMLGTVLSEQHFCKVFSAVAGLAVIIIAFIALGGEKPEKIISCITDVVYAAVCFITGSTAMFICGVLMLVGAVAALASVFLFHYREFLMEFSPLKIREEHYTLKEGAVLRDVYIQKPVELPPPPPPKSELMTVAEQYMELFK